jgi:hypothetical protein
LIGVLALVFAILVVMIPESAADARGAIRVVARLDDFTRNNPTSSNTIPDFLSQAGRVGVVPAQPPTDPGAVSPALTTADVMPIDEQELAKGICAATLPRLVRQQYPGTYDDISDEQLEKTVLAQHPEYRDRLCVFPVWITADPHDIVKYDVESARTLGVGNTRLLKSGLIAVVFGAAAVLYMKLRIRN